VEASWWWNPTKKSFCGSLVSSFEGKEGRRGLLFGGAMEGASSLVRSCAVLHIFVQTFLRRKVLTSKKSAFGGWASLNRVSSERSQEKILSNILSTISECEIVIFSLFVRGWVLNIEN